MNREIPAILGRFSMSSMVRSLPTSRSSYRWRRRSYRASSAFGELEVGGVLKGRNSGDGQRHAITESTCPGGVVDAATFLANGRIEERRTGSSLVSLSTMTAMPVRN